MKNMLLKSILTLAFSVFILNVYSQKNLITYPTQINRFGQNDVIGRTLSLNIFITMDTTGGVPLDNTGLNFSAGNPSVSLAVVDTQIDILNAHYFDLGLQFKRAKVTYIANNKYNYWIQTEESSSGTTNNPNRYSDFRATYAEDSVINVVFVGYYLANRNSSGQAAFGQGTFDQTYRSRPLIVLGVNFGIGKDSTAQRPYLARFMSRTLGLGSVASDVELVDRTNCDTEGDRICDTPAEPGGGQYLPLPFGCGYIGVGGVLTLDPKGFPYAPLNGNMTSNISVPCIAAPPRSLTTGQLNRLTTLYYDRWKRFK